MEEMVEELARRKAREQVWVSYYRAHKSVIREPYHPFDKEEIEWIMNAAIQHCRNWKKITGEHAKAFPHVIPARTSHSIYSKWGRQWRKEEEVRAKDPSLVPWRPGHSNMKPPAKRVLAKGKQDMITKALAEFERQSGKS